MNNFFSNSYSWIISKVRGNSAEIRRFDSLMEIARNIAERDPTALTDYVRLLGRRHQAYWMCEVVARQEHGAPYVNPEQVMFPLFSKVSPNGNTIDDLKVKIRGSKSLRLSRDLILPCPWARSRVINNFTSIGKQRRDGQWTQDRSNHAIEYWLPIGIGWVHGGNHSIAIGIVQGQGSIKTPYVYDISRVYEYIRTDGINYLRKDGSTLCKVKNIEFAAIFEIGRLMIKHGVSA